MTHRIQRSGFAITAIVLALMIGLIAPAAAQPPTGGGAAGTGDGAAERLIVGLEPDVSPAQRAALADGVGGEISESIEQLHVHVLELPETADPRAVEALRRDPRVAYVETDVVVEAVREPNDPAWSQQWSPKVTRAPKAWSLTTGASSVVVAVLDTGVDDRHEDLQKALVKGRNIIDGNNDTRDRHGHGTGAAGVIAARTDNGIGVASYCWTCSIMPVKVLGDDGSGFASHVAAGIVWAADNGADIINMSLGASQGTRAMQDAVRYAEAKGVLLVASAGNDGEKRAGYPAAYAEVVGVAATDSSDRRYSWSNYGPDVDVAAPGCNRSTLLDNRYGNFCGTSSAAPVVAGIAGLVAARHASATGVDLRRAVSATAKDIGSVVAFGRVDTYGGVIYFDSNDLDSSVTERIAGTDRIATAVALSQATFSSGARTVLIARADTYPDALAGAPLAHALGAPILLTPADRLDDAVRTEIGRLSATRAVLLGSTGALSEQVRRDLERAGVSEVVRHGGGDRFSTAAAIADALQRAGGDAGHAYLVQGVDPDPARGWPDAVAVAGLAAMRGHPILLTHSDRLPAQTADALAALGVREVTIVGGQGVVSTAVATELADRGLRVRRIAGADRYETSRKVADATVAAGADASSVWVATGRNFPDALSAGPAVAADGGVLLLVDGHDLDRSAAARDWLEERGSTMARIRLVGGTGVISPGVASSISTLAE